MSDRNTANIKKQLESISIDPSPRVWDRIDDKLQNKKNKYRAKYYRILAIAVCAVAIISITVIYQHQIHDHNPHMYAYNSAHNDIKPTIIEDLNTSTDEGIYAVSQLQNLNNAYKELGL